MVFVSLFVFVCLVQTIADVRKVFSIAGRFSLYSLMRTPRTGLLWCKVGFKGRWRQCLLIFLTLILNMSGSSEQTPPLPENG